MTNDPDHEPHHATSPTGHILEELALYGHRPFDDEPDPSPLPEANQITGAIVDIFDALVVTLQDTRLEPDLETSIGGEPGPIMSIRGARRSGSKRASTIAAMTCRA